MRRKRVKNFPNYFVTECGKVFSENLGAFLKFDINNKSYLRVVLYNDSERKRFLLHRLVAMHWVRNPKPDVKTQVNHLDKNKWNCAADNLQWVTDDENKAHAKKTFYRPNGRRYNHNNAKEKSGTPF